VVAPMRRGRRLAEFGRGDLGIAATFNYCRITPWTHSERHRAQSKAENMALSSAVEGGFYGIRSPTGNLGLPPNGRS